MRKINNLTSGLFNISPKYPISFIKHTIKDFFIMLKRLGFVIRHGYYPAAHYETYEYMLSIWKEIFTWYRDNRCGSGIILEPIEPNDENWQKKNEEAYTEFYNKMLAELDTMGIDLLDYPDAGDEQEAAKNRFFEMFKKIFYDLWD